MRIASRILVVALLLLTSASCRKKSEPNEPESNGNATAKAVYELDVAKHAIPASPVEGSIGGADFTPTVELEGDYLAFRVSKPGTPADVTDYHLVLLRVNGGSGQQLPVGKLVVRPDVPPGPEVPEVMVSVAGKPITSFSNGYAMTLELQPRKAGRLTGRIYLCLPDAEKSFLAGTFVAAAPRLPTEPPGVEDIPFINGKVTVIGAPPGANLITGYVAIPNGSTSKFGIAAADLDLARIEGEVGRWTQRDFDKPRVTFLIAGDGKNVPSRYEHSKLPQGRYLTFAMLKDGPAAWKWVDVGERSTVAADLTIDLSKSGGLEVTAPLGSLAKVQLVPKDEHARTPMDSNLFSLIALHLHLEQDIVARKVLFKYLGPGKYDVRDTASGQIRTVEVVPGKTIELDFDAKPLSPVVTPAPDPKPKG